MPVYYFPREDVRLDLLKPVSHSKSSAFIGKAFYWTPQAGDRSVENGAWSYAEPVAELDELKDFVAFDWSRLDHRFEEDEEVFGHPRDPYHRVDVRQSTREVLVVFRDEVIARTRAAQFLFETGLPTRHYIPPGDVRKELLIPTETSSICPYKGTASYWSIRVGADTARDAVWSYPDLLPDCPHIKGHFCFYPERVDRIDVAGR